MRTRCLVLASLASAVIAYAEPGETLFDLDPITPRSNGLFGYAVAVDDGRIAVGALRDRVGVATMGVVYIYDAATGVRLDQLAAMNASSFEFLGCEVAIDDGIVIGGAYGLGVNGSFSGGAYTFDLQAGAQLARLLPNDGAPMDFGGWSVGISEGRAIVGARGSDVAGTDSGSAYLFDAATGVQLLRLAPDDHQASQFFGIATAIEANIAVVGASRDNEAATDAGAVYVFNADTGQQLRKILPPEPDVGTAFGEFVALDNGRLLVGEPFRTSASGAAYLYDVHTGQVLQTLIPAGLDAGDRFGTSVDLDGDIAIIGAYRDDDAASDAGAAYLFDLTTGQQIAKVTSTDGEQDDWFGWSVGIGSGVGVAGARLANNGANDSGGATVFETEDAGTNQCPADFNNDGVVDGADFGAFGAAFGSASGDPSYNLNADFNGDGQVDGADFGAFGAEFGRTDCLD
jgi:hypothetical protein